VKRKSIALLALVFHPDIHAENRRSLPVDLPVHVNISKIIKISIENFLFRPPTDRG